MKRYLTTFALVAVCSVAVRADVTVTTEVTIEGPIATMMSGAMPRMIMRVKGTKARTDLEVMGQTISTITDLTARQVTVLMPAQKTAHVFDPPRPEDQAANVPAMPKVNVTFQPTGRSQTIGGQLCDQFAFSTTMDMSQTTMLNSQVPKEIAEMLKGVTMTTKGDVCVAKRAPGAEEYAAFMKAATAANLASAASASNLGPGQGALDQVMRLFAGADGIAYLSEAQVSLDGTGPMVELMKQLSSVKLTSKVTDVSVMPIADDLFAVPADYTVTKP